MAHYNVLFITHIDFWKLTSSSKKVYSKSMVVNWTRLNTSSRASICACDTRSPFSDSISCLVSGLLWKYPICFSTLALGMHCLLWQASRYAVRISLGSTACMCSFWNMDIGASWYPVIRSMSAGNETVRACEHWRIFDSLSGSSALLASWATFLRTEVAAEWDCCWGATANIDGDVGGIGDAGEEAAVPVSYRPRRSWKQSCSKGKQLKKCCWKTKNQRLSSPVNPSKTSSTYSLPVCVAVWGAKEEKQNKSDCKRKREIEFVSGTVVAHCFDHFSARSELPYLEMESCGRWERKRGEGEKKRNERRGTRLVVRDRTSGYRYVVRRHSRVCGLVTRQMGRS